MGAGSGFGGWNSNRQQIKMEPNPMDKCTIVSAYHKPIKAEKPTITPGYFTVPAATGDGFELFVVGSSSWWKEVDEYQPFLEIPCSSFQVANSIVNDFVNSLLGAKGHGQKPAVFVVLGEYDKNTINGYIDKINKKPFKILLSEAKEAQKRYYAELVRIADVYWARTSGNPLAISDDARMAALNLGVDKNKPWMQDFKMMELENCKSCGFQVNPLYPVCPNCRNPISGLVPVNAMTAGAQQQATK